MMKEEILGFLIEAQTAGKSVDRIFCGLTESLRSRSTTFAWLACLNPHSYAVSRRDRDFATALHDANWLIPDGIGVIWASCFLGGQVRATVNGSDIFFGLARDA